MDLAEYDRVKSSISNLFGLIFDGGIIENP